jgi:hypothetical protein
MRFFKGANNLNNNLNNESNKLLTMKNKLQIPLPLSNGEMFYPEQAVVIWRLSFLIFFTAMHAYYRKHYDMAAISGTIFLTSVNHWRKPVHNSLRRKVDVTCVINGVIYHIIRANHTKSKEVYFTVLIFSLFFFFLGKYFDIKKRFWSSIYSHATFHLMGNIANNILYSGDLIPVGFIKE